MKRSLLPNMRALLHTTVPVSNRLAAECTCCVAHQLPKSRQSDANLVARCAQDIFNHKAAFLRLTDEYEIDGGSDSDSDGDGAGSDEHAEAGSGSDSGELVGSSCCGAGRSLHSDVGLHSCLWTATLSTHTVCVRPCRRSGTLVPETHR